MLVEQLRPRQRCRVDRHLVRAGIEHGLGVGHRADAAADRERDEHVIGGPARELDDGVALVRGRGDVEEHELVRARGVVATGQLDGIAGVAQVDEPDALDDTTAVDVEAWDHALVVHQRSSTACASPTVNRPSYRALPTITARRLTCRSSTSARRSSSEATPPEYAS